MLEHVTGIEVTANGLDDAICRACFNELNKSYNVIEKINKWKEKLSGKILSPEKTKEKKKRVLSPSVRRTPEKFLKKRIKTGSQTKVKLISYLSAFSS